VAALFILVNSLPSAIGLWAVAAAAGAVVPSELGVRRFAERTFRRLLAVALAVAAVKLIVMRR
jgi:uncharacterized membrane protein YfcA